MKTLRILFFALVCATAFTHNVSAQIYYTYDNTSATVNNHIYRPSPNCSSSYYCNTNTQYVNTSPSYYYTQGCYTYYYNGSTRTTSIVGSTCQSQNVYTYTQPTTYTYYTQPVTYTQPTTYYTQPSTYYTQPSTYYTYGYSGGNWYAGYNNSILFGDYSYGNNNNNNCYYVNGYYTCY